VFGSLAIFGLALASGQPERAPTVDEVRTQTRMITESMCGSQCDVVDVRIKTKRATPVGSVTPGFDDVREPRMVPSEIDLVLLFDSKLAAEYRRFVEDRVKYRIGELGLPVLVTQQVKNFPAPPQLPPDNPQPQQPQPQPQVQPVIIQQPAPAKEEAQKPQAIDLKEAFVLKVLEALPLLLLFGLLAWLILRVLRRLEEIGAKKRPGLDEDDEDKHSVTLMPEVIEETKHISSQPGGMSLPPPSPDRLIADLRTHRGSTRRIFRRLLVRGQHDLVARTVALLGDFVVEDLAHDPAVRQALHAAGLRTAEILRSPMTDDDSEEALRTIQAELVADRVAHRADDVRKEFEVLLGWGPEAFAACMNRLDVRLSLLLLRHAPPFLSESYLLGLAPTPRADMVRKLLAEPPAEPEEIEALAEAIEAEKGAAIVGGYEADHIVDLLDSLPAPEQEEVVGDLESTRPDFVRRNLGQLPVESALLRVPDHAIAAAWAQVAFDDWIAYLRVAPAAIRDRAIAACPQRLREALVEELSLRVAPDVGRATNARRKIVRAALSAAPGNHGTELALVEREKSEVKRVAPPPSSGDKPSKS
jgi:flagellar FliG-like protein